MTSLSVPIAHGEGKFNATPEYLRSSRKTEAVALTYEKGRLRSSLTYQQIPMAQWRIAGFTGEMPRL